MPRPCAHASNSMIFAGQGSPRDQLPICVAALIFGMPSRKRRDSRACTKSSVSIWAHRARTGLADASRTSVIRPSFDCRRNSTRTKGPSVNQPERIGSSRGSQTSEPHPRHAITATIPVSPDVSKLESPALGFRGKSPAVIELQNGQRPHLRGLWFARLTSCKDGAHKVFPPLRSL